MSQQNDAAPPRNLPPKKLPHEILLEQCKKIAGTSVWALGVGKDKHDKFQWEVFCSDKNMIKKLPREFLGNEVVIVLSAPPPKPNLLIDKK
jgi:hypothetical protein